MYRWPSEATMTRRKISTRASGLHLLFQPLPAPDAAQTMTRTQPAPQRPAPPAGSPRLLGRVPLSRDVGVPRSLSATQRNITLIVDFYFHSEVYETAAVMDRGLPRGCYYGKKVSHHIPL